MAKSKGVLIDLKKTNKSVEQALRDLRIQLEDEMELLKQNRYHIKPTTKKRERNKVRKANIRKYNKYN